MDGKGLAAFMENLTTHDNQIIRKEFALALRLASDPAQLVLTAVGFIAFPFRWSCVNLLEKLQQVAPEVGPTVREKALMQAAKWAKISLEKDRDHTVDVITLLQFIATFNIVAKFDHEQLLELFSTISRRGEKHAMMLVKNLNLIDKFPELIQKLSSKGRQLFAVRLIYAYGMTEKAPPAPLLEAYAKESRRIAQEIQKRGKGSRKFVYEAIGKELGALQSVAKYIEDYKLENEYPCQDLEKRMSELEQQTSELEQQKFDKKEDAAGASVSLPDKKQDDAGASVSISRQQQEQQQSNRRSRQLASSPVHAMPGNPYPPSIQNNPQYGLADHASSYMTGPYGLTASGSVYNHVLFQGL